MDGARVDYFHLAKNIGEKEATINFRHDNKEWRFSVTFKRKEYRDRQDGSPYTLAENIEFKEPENFDGTHFVQNVKGGRGRRGYFDFKLAKTIAKEILNDPRFI